MGWDWREWRPKKQALGQDWDAVVVGSGLGGLMCAAKLAATGRRCLVLEAHYQVGGYAHHFQRKHKGAKYLFDVALHQTGELRTGGAMHGMLTDVGVLDLIELREKDELYRSIFPGIDATVPVDIEAYRAMLKEKFPAESEEIDRLFAIMVAIPEEAERLGPPGDAPPENMAELAPTMMRYMTATLADVLDDTVQDPQLRAIFTQLWGYVGLPPSECSAIVWAQMWCSFHLGGSFYIRGGGQALSHAFAKVIEDAGGAIKRRTIVEQILVDDTGRAYGIRTAKGDEFHAPVIVSNSSTIETFNSLVDRQWVPDNLLTQVNEMPIGMSAVVAYIGMDGNAAELGLSDHALFVNLSLDAEAEWAAGMRGAWEDAGVIIANKSLMNDQTCPPGKSVIEILTVGRSEDWIDVPEDVYAERKAAVTEFLLDRMTEIIPDIRERIEVIEVGTPKTMADFSRNPRGAFYGYANSATTHSVFRPQQRTPIPGLYLASAWTFPGGGFGGAMASGYTAATQILADTQAVEATP